ncbi:MAG: hypothetical protein NTV72_02240 [Candidatus Taylorbacteria bacterium]|nr:hypothetical protein [Candidatus Taylorbacteria bacterium]
MKLRQSLFWDTNPDKVDIQKNAQYIIERVLDFGRDTEVKWLYETYDKSLLRNTILNSRSLMPGTKKLWTLILKTK